MEQLAQHWEGPMSLALYIDEAEIVNLSYFVNTSPTLRGRENIAIHIVYKQGVRIYKKMII